jgi:hypothetical protein
MLGASTVPDSEATDAVKRRQRTGRAPFNAANNSYPDAELRAARRQRAGHAPAPLWV